MPVGLPGWSELFERKRAVFFFGLSTVDFDLGRPTLGIDVSATALTSAFFMVGVAPSWASFLSRRAIGEGVPERDLAACCCLMFSSDFQKGLELLRL